MKTACIRIIHPTILEPTWVNVDYTAQELPTRDYPGWPLEIHGVFMQDGTDILDILPEADYDYIKEKL